MTQSPTAPPMSGTPKSALKRPATLLALLVISGISALSGLVGAIFALSGGRGLAEQYATDVINTNPEELGVNELLELTGGSGTGDVIATLKEFDMWDTLISAAQGELILKSVLLLIFVVPVLLFTLFAINGATWARVLITIFAVFSLLGHLIAAITDSQVLMTLQIMGYVGLVTAIIAIVLCWLPANGRYAKARKLAV
ncbi:hypothetical protein MOQ72_40515 [Saccharopolyspora sp. K220]|uniref:hypothetical protein n=1 Tax=Saccharopolyspora soli TaxID=2926618 RepID=UPI001F5A99F1|nr:hypothetical protein [Saccharopolyspora soli]MCI2423708.1 hypothetical protein [Saccharopolyspora soli]